MELEKRPGPITEGKWVNMHRVLSRGGTGSNFDSESLSICLEGVGLIPNEVSDLGPGYRRGKRKTREEQRSRRNIWIETKPKVEPPLLALAVFFSPHKNQFTKHDDPVPSHRGSGPQS